MNLKKINFYSNSIKHKIADDNSYNIYWSPIAAALKGIKKVYFSSDGVFNKVNFNTLKIPNKKTYLIDEIEIDLVTNTADLLNKERDPLTSTYAVLIGNPEFGGDLKPLPGSEMEIHSVKSILNEKQWRDNTLLGEHATEEALKDMIKPNILHIATHGFFNESTGKEVNYNNNPLFQSGLMLSGSNQGKNTSALNRRNFDLGIEDGVLTSYEVLNLNIDNSELVVLSACETGLGEIKNGEGVYGLQRAFQLAGTRSLLMSLWKVDDAVTQKLMTTFYQNWFSGQQKSAAFINAQKQIRNEYPEPCYWGSFVLIED